jgi:hypothetical protein
MRAIGIQDADGTPAILAHDLVVDTDTHLIKIP